MVDAKTIETFLKGVNGSIQPDHKLILENFLRLDERVRAERITRSKILIEKEDIASIEREYGTRANHELAIQRYRLGQMTEKLDLYSKQETQCEAIIKSYERQVSHT